jgi:hypothetical protein
MRLTRKDFLRMAAATTVGSMTASTMEIPSQAHMGQASSDPGGAAGAKGRKRPLSRGVTQEVLLESVDTLKNVRELVGALT